MSVYIIAEGGINHNGDIKVAKRLIDAAVFAGADAIKWQKRTPKLCVPRDQWDVPRETPWGTMSYIDYRQRMEFDYCQWQDLSAYAAYVGIDIGGSAWDVPSLQVLAKLGRRWVKVPSAKLTDLDLLKAAVEHFQHVILSTGMSTEREVDEAVRTIGNTAKLTLLHCHSSYPAPSRELNLRSIPYLQARYGCRVGYSGHEYGLRPTLGAVALGAQVVERHITLDKQMWGTDHQASVEPLHFAELVRHIRSMEESLGEPAKKLWPSEEPARVKLRGMAA